MKAELLKRLFRAIASSDPEALDKLTCLVIEEERSKGHTALAQQLENIKSKNKQEKPTSSSQTPLSTPETTLQDLQSLPTSKRFNLPLVTFVPREKLRHHMILPVMVEKRFQRIEREYAARDRLAHHGLRYRQKILLYGSPGCGKTLGAERLAWNTGLSLLKVRFDAMVSSFLGETASNLRLVFEKASESPCLLFLDECDVIAKSREDTQEVGEIKRVVNTFLQILDEYEPNSGLLVAATNLNKSLDTALWRRFDDVIEIPKPGEAELKFIIKQTLSAIDVGVINWDAIVQDMKGFSAAQAVRVAQDAAKRAILEREELVIQEHLEDAIQEIKVSFS
ncbi:ATP-binding protein [Gloeothece verrucosa]|uniref:AAA ATPase central domain protein n=1 Tax=Gloeothece verrucosa (strain PCC 7822) TaxID=497965 RepID=E0U897_GLOV7|nr:ATP-binding protein [Gloeothece verrucosa]ADN12533.1 AAA ATPase central domain protein [Gloeothece verrucosa PCC 7822]ADN12935.1 AAA ATPase central domain protein [Gloeothece verrucosa PCC 7822]